jgi:hypothetical protein
MTSIIKLKKSSIGSADTTGFYSSKENTELNLILNKYNNNDQVTNTTDLKSTSSDTTSSSSVKEFFKNKFAETKRILSLRNKTKEKTRGSESNVDDQTANNESFTSGSPTHTDSNNLRSEIYTSSSSSLSSSSFSFLNDSVSNNENKNKANIYTRCKICFNKYPDLEPTGQLDSHEKNISRTFQLDSCRCKYCLDVSL